MAEPSRPDMGMLPKPSAFEPWLRRLPGFANASVASIQVADGGASNITCCVAVTDGAYPAVALRLQRERGIFEPYDVLREGEVLRRLANSAVPVPRMLGGEADRAVLGAPFIVMEWVDAPHMGLAPDADYAAFTAAVAAVHRADWQALGLHFLGVPADARAAVLAELDTVAARMPAFGCQSEPLLVSALATLRGVAPGGGTLQLCQGDINIFNYLFRGGKVVAVVDWEQARIGDARSDVGQLVALSHLKGAPFGPVGRMNFVLAYEAATGRTLTNMAYFRALWLFELGVIFRGWMAFNESEPWYSWSRLTELLEASLAEIA
ncbi:MAG: phosphotransferase family protein [Tepidiformaceae bacterium]